MGKKQDKPQREEHRFDRRVSAWPYCSKCGLVYLKNEFTEWAVRIGCDYKDHPQYTAKRLEYTALGRE